MVCIRYYVNKYTVLRSVTFTVYYQNYNRRTVPTIRPRLLCSRSWVTFSWHWIPAIWPCCPCSTYRQRSISSIMIHCCGGYRRLTVLTKSWINGLFRTSVDVSSTCEHRPPRRPDCLWCIEFLKDRSLDRSSSCCTSPTCWSWSNVTSWSPMPMQTTFKSTVSVGRALSTA